MAAKEEELSVGELFGELSKFFKEADYLKALKVANKILAVVPDDLDAIHSKIVCLIQQSCFQEALDVINSIAKKGELDLPFEKAYCLYRLNKLNEAEGVLLCISSPSLKEKELLAQVQYRLENYMACFGLYKDIIRNSQDDYGEERGANMLAVAAASKLWNNEDVGEPQIPVGTYELCYNYACLMLARGDLDAAVKKLDEAEGLCRKSFEGDDDVAEDEIEEELGVIKAQRAYILQLRGQTEEALKSYNAILKNKPSDVALGAVISNNIVAVNKDKDLFDSKKRLRSMNAPGLENKLTRVQQQNMEINKCLLSMFMNQIDACKKSLTKLKTQFPVKGSRDEDKAAILEAAVYLRDKHPDQAMEHLQKMIQSGVESNEIRLSVAQLLLSKGRVQDALVYLGSVSDQLKYSPALVSLTVSLLNHLGDRDQAERVLDAAVAFGECNRGIVKKSNLVILLRENASAKIASGKMEEAVLMLEKLRREDPDDINALAKIVAAYSRINLAKAQQYSKDLPEFKSDKRSIDVNALEMVDMIGSFRFSKKGAANGASDERVVSDAKEDVVAIKKKSKKKKRKGKLPKNYNPDVDPDPERWLPRWERSTFKHKKHQKRGGQYSVGKGTQGATNEIPTSPKPGSAPTSPRPGTPNDRDSASSPNVVPPRKQNPQPGKTKAKKKKKAGAGW